MARVFLIFAALFGLTGVGLGAFAAHGLRGRLTPAYLDVFQTGVHYQQIHALALLGAGLLALRLRSRMLLAAGVLFGLGILLFSGSLYLLTLSGLGRLGMITPFGGVCLMAGWLLLGMAALRLRPLP